MGNQQMGGDSDVDGYEYYDGMGGAYQRYDEMEEDKYVKMLDNRSKDDSKCYLQQYPTHALDDLKLDLNWAFYDNQVTNMGDEIAAKVEEMHAWKGDYEKLERQHDYIQFLFPLMDPSLFNHKIQLLQRHEVRRIRRDKKASLRVRKSFEMMLDFFGFQLSDTSKGTVERKKSPDDLPEGWVKKTSMMSGDTYYEHKPTGHKCLYQPGSALDRLASLNTPGNHNFRRISRIIKCLGDLGFERYQLPFLLRLAEEIYVHKTLTEAQSSFEKYWKVFLIGDANRRILERYLCKIQKRTVRTEDPLPVQPSFRLVYQPKVVRQEEENDAKDDDEVEEEDMECLAQSNIQMGSDIVILMHGVKATGRNWIGLYQVGDLDENVGNRVMSIPAIPGSETFKKQQQMKSDMLYPSEVRKALVMQREHVQHFVPQIQAGKKLHPRRIKKCKYGTHNGVSAIVVTHPNVDSVVVPGTTFDIRWIAAPYAEMAFGNDEFFEIIVQERGPHVKTAIYATQKTDILKGSYSWQVPKDMKDGTYFIRIRKRGFQSGDLEYHVPSNDGFTIVSSTDVSDVALPAPVKLAARKSSERKESGIENEKKSSGNNVEGSLRWSGTIGPWEPGMYEFRYFDAGWDFDTDSHLFVPGRGCVCKSPPFKVEKSNGTFRIMKPLDPPAQPKDEELASHDWKLKEKIHFEKMKERKKLRDVVHVERALGLHRGFTTVKAQYKGKWYKGEFVRSKTKNGEIKFGVQCDSDPKGTITWVSQEKLRIIEEDKPKDHDGWGML